MKQAIYTALQNKAQRYEILKTLLADPQVVADRQRYRDLSKEFSDLTPVIQLFTQYQQETHALKEAQELLNDAELQSLAKIEIKQIEERLIQIEQALFVQLIPNDPYDQHNIFLEIRAGTGGSEAAIFAGDLCRMYLRYAESQRFQVEMMSESYGEHGGYKEVIMRIIGRGVYSRFKFESGVHRVQRVPETEAQGRVHTSTCTVAVLPELEEIESIDLKPSEMRVDTFRASGAGGQHVQKTDSAIRITHLPTGIVVECQDERSQHKNRARALSLLKCKILTMERNKQKKQQAETRRQLVGTGDRSERIRTYNFSQGRLTDHRIQLTLYQLLQILEGDLQPVIDALSEAHRADGMAMLGEDSTK